MTTPHYGQLFHFTHPDNLGTVLAGGSLLCDSAVCSRRLLTTEAGDPEIKARRRNQPVSCAPGGVVADYVPFYFAARSPMMYKLWVGGVPSFSGDHRDLVYLVSHVDRIVTAGVDFVISDRNAAKALAEFTNDVGVLGDLAANTPSSTFVDWPLMRATMWNNTPSDGERMERRMAEFLIHGEVPLNLIESVAVRSEKRKSVIERMFVEARCPLPVHIRPDWYFS